MLQDVFIQQQIEDAQGVDIAATKNVNTFFSSQKCEVFELTPPYMVETIGNVFDF